MTRRPAAIAAAALLAVAAAPRPAAAAEQWYGASGGVLIPLDPTDEVGASASVWAAVDAFGEDGENQLAVRGALFGTYSGESRAFLPTLTGDAGFRFGRMDIFLTVGVELFGVAQRGDWTVFSTLGFVGGAGVSVAVTKDVRLSLRGHAIWLPEFSAGVMGDRPAGDRPTFLYLTGTLGFEIAYRGVVD